MKRVRLVCDKAGDLPKYLVGRAARIVKRDKSQDDHDKKAYKVIFDGQKKERTLWEDEFIVLPTA